MLESYGENQVGTRNASSLLPILDSSFRISFLFAGSTEWSSEARQRDGLITELFPVHVQALPKIIVDLWP